MNIIGIDPGKSGGIALLNDSTILMPFDEDIRKLLLDIQFYLVGEETNTIKTNTKVLIEKQWARTGFALSTQTKLVFNYGLWVGSLKMFSYQNLDIIPPTRWMNYYVNQGYEIPKKRQDRKKYLKTLASELYPDVKVTLKTCDALLIAHYGRSLIE